MTTLVERPHDGAFVISCANGNQSFDGVLVRAIDENQEEAVILQAGSLLARAVSNTQVAATAGNSGNGTIADVELGTGYKIGAYKLVCVEPAADAGNFALYDPAGKFVGKVVVAVAFSGEIQFTVADGGNNFVAGDSFTIYVHGATMFGTSVYVPYAYNGSTGQPAGILYGEVSVPAYDADLNLGNVRAVMLARQAEVFAEAFEDATGADIATLAAMGILFR